ncbi:MAG TPA: hypothetical protein VFE29_04275 [Terriglobia bacterium]|nr:hypothetical protein [Terriglobia bacterium]
MSLSRRQFFRGFKGPTPEQLRERRTRLVETYVRTNLLPYDFALTAAQTAEALAAAVAGVDLAKIEDTLTPEHRLRLRDIVDEMVLRWRTEYLQAEDIRREGASLVTEFLLLEATPEDREKLRARFHVPYPAVLDEEIERQVRIWLGGLSNAFLAGTDPLAIRDLVFSELRSWC